MRRGRDKGPIEISLKLTSNAFGKENFRKFLTSFFMLFLIKHFLIKTIS